MSDMSDIKSLIEAQGTAWEEFKKTNDEVIKAKADGKAVGDLETKLETLSKALDESKANMEKVEARLNRKGLAAGEIAEGDIDAEVKSFNINRRAYSTSAVERDFTKDEYIAYTKAFNAWARKGSLDQLSDADRKSMLAGSDPNGGYMLPTPTIGRVVAKIYELSPIRQLATVQPISTQALEGLYDNDEASVGYVGEVAARPNTNTPVVGKYRIEAFEQYANPKVSQTLLDDAAVDVEAWLAGKIANKFARFEGSEFINGTGVGHIRGFNSYTFAATADGTRAWGTIEQKKTGANGTFIAGATGPDILIDLIQAFKTAYLQRAQWVTTREVIGLIRKLKEATTNAYIWQPGLAQGTPDKLLGYPVVNAQDLPALASNGNCLWLGDWKEAYTIVDRQGLRTIRDNLTDKPNVQFYTTRRTGGGVLNFEALKTITFST